MEVIFILGITVRIFLSIFKMFFKTKLIYPISLLFMMSVLLRKGIFIDCWNKGNLFYWGFYFILFMAFIPFIKKLFNLLRRFHIKTRK